MAVTLVNNYICAIHNSAIFATLFYAILDTHSGRLTYLNAGHDLPYIIRKNLIFNKLHPTGPLVGAVEGAEYATQSLNLKPGDMLVLYSDGVTDARDRNGEMLTQQRWQLLLEQSLPPFQNLLTFLKDSILDFIGDAPQYDDISLVTVQRS